MSNFLAVLVAAIAAFAVGALWYGPLFGKPWRKLMGLAEGTRMGGKMSLAASMVGGFIATLVMVYVLAVFMNVLLVSLVVPSIVFACVIVIGFIATSMLNSVFYEGRPWQLWLINVGHYLVALSVAAIILALW